MKDVGEIQTEIARRRAQCDGVNDELSPEGLEDLDWIEALEWVLQ
jgi:hypothetical protein